MLSLKLDFCIPAKRMEQVSCPLPSANLQPLTTIALGAAEGWTWLSEKLTMLRATFRVISSHRREKSAAMGCHLRTAARCTAGEACR